MTIFLLLSFFLVLSTESMDAPGGGSSQTVSYDELLLVFQCPTSYCNTGMNKCNHPIPLEFKLHGLWLNKNSKSVNCPTPNSRIKLDRQVFSLSLLRLATKSMKNSSPLFWKAIVFFLVRYEASKISLFSVPFLFLFFFPFPLWLCYKAIYTQQLPSQDCFFFSFSFLCVWFVWVGEKLFDPLCMGLFGCFTLNHIRSEKHNHAG